MRHAIVDSTAACTRAWRAFGCQNGRVGACDRAIGHAEESKAPAKTCLLRLERSETCPNEEYLAGGNLWSYGSRIDVAGRRLS
jgi:hypothetical protein